MGVSEAGVVGMFQKALISHFFSLAEQMPLQAAGWGQVCFVGLLLGSRPLKIFELHLFFPWF